MAMIPGIRKSDLEYLCGLEMNNISLCLSRISIKEIIKNMAIEKMGIKRNKVSSSAGLANSIKEFNYSISIS